MFVIFLINENLIIDEEIDFYCFDLEIGGIVIVFVMIFYMMCGFFKGCLMLEIVL